MLDTRFALRDPATLHPHEEVRPQRVEELVERIRKDGHIQDPIVVDRDTGVVLDGHHRLTALQRLGCRSVPVHLVNYHDPSIELDTWREDRNPPTKEEVVERALAGDLFPPKTTKHLDLDRLGKVPVRLVELGLEEDL